MSLIAALVSRDRALLLSDGAVTHNDKIIRHDFSKIFILPGGMTLLAVGELNGAGLAERFRYSAVLSPNDVMRIIGKWTAENPHLDNSYFVVGKYDNSLYTFLAWLGDDGWKGKLFDFKSQNLIVNFDGFFENRAEVLDRMTKISEMSWVGAEIAFRRLFDDLYQGNPDAIGGKIFEANMQLQNGDLATTLKSDLQMKRVVHTEPVSTANGGATYASGTTVYFHQSDVPSGSGDPYLLDDSGNILPPFDNPPQIALTANNMSTPPLQLYATNITNKCFVMNSYDSGTTASGSGSLSNAVQITVNAPANNDLTSVSVSASVATLKDVDSHGAPNQSGSITINYTIGTSTGSFAINWVSTGGSFGGGVSMNVAANTTSIAVEASWNSSLPTDVSGVTAYYSDNYADSSTPDQHTDFTAIISEPWS